MSALLSTRRPAGRGIVARGAALALVAALAACGGGGSMAKSKPEFFHAKIGDGKLTGSYNPAGFTADEVRKLLATSCNNGKLGSYGEQAQDGLMSFNATCQGGTTASSGAIEFQKAATGVVVEGTVADESGNLSYQRATVAL